MGRSKFRGVMILTAAIVLNSCAVGTISHHRISNHFNNETEIVFAQKNFKVIGDASGDAVHRYVALGLFGIGHEDHIAKAKADMYNNAKLKDGQSIAYITSDVDHDVVGWGFYWNKRVSLHGKIIEFTD